MLEIIKKYCRFLKYTFVIFWVACLFALVAIFCHVLFDEKITLYNYRAQSVTKHSKAEDKKHNVVAKKNNKDIDPTPDYNIPPSVDGYAPILSTIPTKQPVVFLGIDDGAFKDPSVIQIMKDNNIKASLYLARNFIESNTDFFRQITINGSLVENHSINHYLDLSRRSYAVQKAEICGQSDYLFSTYGRKPIFYRPPGGSYNSDTLRAANDCGMKAVVTWIAKANGGSMQYQIGDKLRAGDIVLMHFRPEFKQDMQAFVDAKNAAGLRVVLLEDWLQAPAR